MINRPTLADAIKRLQPDSQFAVAGNTLEGLIWVEGNEFDPPSEEEVMEALAILNTEYDKEFEIETLKREFDVTSEAPVEVTVQEGTYTFNGGNDSASVIFGAISLAQNLGEETVGIWDINDDVYQFSYESALIIARTIGLAWRTLAYELQGKKSEIKKR